MRKFLAKLMPFNFTPGANSPRMDGAHSHADWMDTYLIGHSDTDARWYYERRQWRGQADHG